MSAGGALVLGVRATMRRRRLPAAGLAVLVALGVGAVLTLTAGARRTASAPSRYTASVGGDVDTMLVQPNDRPETDAIRALPVVRELHSVTFLTADVDGVDEVVTLAGDGFAGSRLVAGRRPASSHEFIATRSFVKLAGLRLGGHVTVRAYTQQQTDNHTAFVDAPAGPTFEATLVGVRTSVDELDDPTPVMLFPSSLLDEPIGVVGTVSTVRLQPGTTLDAFRTALGVVPGGDSMFFQPGAIVSTSVRAAVNAQATALWIVAGVVALAVVAALGQVTAGFVRLTPSSRESLRAIGYTSAQSAAEEVASAATLVVPGTAAGVVVAALASAWFPGGFARALEPDPGHIRLDAVVLVIGAAVTGLVVLLWVAVASRVARRRRAASRPSVVADAVSRTGLGPEAGVGIRFALSRDGRDRLSATATLVTLSLAVAAVIGTLVFGSSLGRLVDDGARYGYNYGFVAGAPTGGPLDPSDIEATRSAPGIVGAMALSQASAPVAGHDIDLVGVEPLRGGLLPVVLSGRFPASPDEVAMGELTAASLHVHVGDDATFEGADGGPVTYHVVGIVVLPSVSFGAGGGRGAAMLTTGLKRVSPETEPQQLALQLEPGTAPGTVSLGTDVTPSSGQSRPPDVVNVARARSVPAIVAAVVGLLATVVLIQSLVGSVRARRRDVAVLRALGADRSWITRVVHIQASMVGLIALAAGLPIGILAGRVAYRSFAGRLGLVATPSMPAVVTGSLAVAVLAVANLVAAVPARRARDVPPSMLLRDQ